jgi:hypothetical protein
MQNARSLGDKAKAVKGTGDLFCRADRLCFSHKVQNLQVFVVSAAGNKAANVLVIRENRPLSFLV